MADPLDAILASMAAATGNASPPPAPKPAKPAKLLPAQPSSGAGSIALASSSSKKRDREDPSPSTTLSSIWNPQVEMPLDPAVLRKAEAAASCGNTNINPAMEISRQQTVRLLCNKIRRASEDLGINKLPNSVYETWQFTSKLTVAEDDPLIPHAGSDYSGLFEELRKAGATKSGAMKKCKELTRESERLLRKFSQQNFAVGKKKRVHVAVGEGAMHQLTYGHSSVKLSSAHFAKLREMFARKNGLEGDGSTMAPQEQRTFESALFCLLLPSRSKLRGRVVLMRVVLIWTTNLDWVKAALNEECFDALLEHFDCKMECFASPLNCRYSRFCSAFLDTDFAFGGVGSFFDFAPRSGCFEANPPFIPKLIKRMTDHMTALLDGADGALAFIVIIPTWQETEVISTCNGSTHLRIPQKQHGYCEGKQQIRKTRWRIASFDTSVFFWQNAKARIKWPITEKALESLRVAFKSKQVEERSVLGLRKNGKRVRSAKD
ncbi:hypothetical protein BBJ28_00012643 [Nothophytophthora sp. Chile5]|nr:hypothetical protein BBJ28_00012643 [Nothophytophthora sp. Chile5]